MCRELVYKWHRRFRDGRQTTSDDERSARPPVVDEKLVESVCNIVDEDRRVTVRVIETRTGVSRFTINAVLKERLNMHKVCARWIPRLGETGASWSENCIFPMSDFIVNLLLLV